MTATFNFDGKVALVTGGASGIGEACVLTFARSSAKVLIADLNAELGEQTVAAARQAGGDARFVRTDVRDPASVEHMVDAALQSFGRRDIASITPASVGKQNRLATTASRAGRR